ncbi:MAG: hypothetical protein LBE85_07590 [Candidatus Accumulibacter sp.]|jgi:hypothetical protein|nr:hypothetical protein [Accumulibacter sp.]
MAYISTQTTARAAEAIRQAALADGAGVRIQDTGQQARLDGGGRTVHFYSRHKAEIRAENLQTLDVIKDVVGSRFGRASLRRFEASLGAGVKKGDQPLTARQLQETIRQEMVRNDAGGQVRDLAPNAGPVLERQSWFLEKTAPPLPPQELADAIAAGEGLLAEGPNAALRERLEVLRAARQGDDGPVGQGAFQQGVIDQFAAATRLVQRLPDDSADKMRLLASLNGALREAVAAIDRTVVTPGSNAAREIKENAERAIGAALKQLEGMTLEDGAAPLSKGDVQRLVKEANIGQLNQGGRWEPIAKTVEFPVGAGRIPVQVRSTITPAGHTGARFAQGYRDAVGQVTGVSSTDTGNREHAVNLARTTLTDAAGNTIFHAVRHGVCSAFGIDDKAERLAANRTRAVEIMTLSAQDAVRANPGLLEAARGGVLELPLVSLSLLTPDAFRRGAGNEARFLREQNAALRSLVENPPTITVNDAAGNPVELRVRPQLANFNFPVNAAPQGNALLRGVAGGYLGSHGQNKEAFHALLGENFMRTGNPRDLGGIARERIGSLPPAQQEEVRELARQCRDLWQGDGHKDRRETPYRLPARLAVLASRLGFPPAFNCKSGKDRTGQMDVEAKTVAAFLAQHGRPPGLSGPDTGALQQIRIPMALEGGNHEMQIKNTGFAGFKTLGVQGLDRALGGEMPRVIGFAKLVRD